MQVDTEVTRRKKQVLEHFFMCLLSTDGLS